MRLSNVEEQVMTEIEKQPTFWNRPAFALLTLSALAFLFNWPYLKGGFYADDFLIMNMLEQDPLPFSRWLGVWSMQGNIPCFDNLWWKDAGWAASFWRPISSLVLEASLAVFGKNPFPLHLLSILLHAGVAVSVYLMVRKLTNQHFLALLAGLFYVTCEDHSFGIGWISTITDPLCVAFIMISLLCHIHWLQKRSKAALAGSVLALLIALGCKETAAAAPLVIILLTLAAPNGKMENEFSWENTKKQFGKVLRDYPSWIPAAVILVGFPVFYMIFDLAAMNNLGYINPLSSPYKFLSHMVVHLPIFWVGTFSVFPPFAAWFWPELIPPAAASGLILFIIWITALWSFRKNILIVCAFILYMITLLPQLGTDASERGLYFPLVPASILLAYLAVNVKPIATRLYGRIKVQSRWTRFVGWLTILTILIPGTLISILRPWALLPAFGQPEREMLTVLPLVEQFEPDNIVILNTSGFSLTFYTHDILNWHLKNPQNAWLLSAAHARFDLQRTGDSSFVIRADRSGWLDNPFARILRSKPVFESGYTYNMPFFTATILEITDDGSDILSVQFDFRNTLEDKSRLFLRWNGTSFEPFDFSTMEIGETIKLADTSDLLKAVM